ncbi:site-specific integrase [Streptosporangium subroseum]|uniref:site-specific integrase n=1 Tax=Streptosporangium subroseum TaxID=106412 RepID=UPI003421BC73
MSTPPAAAPAATALARGPLPHAAGRPGTVAFFRAPPEQRRPALPAIDLEDAYGVHRLTAIWLESQNSPTTAAEYHRDLTLWLTWCAARGLDALGARVADVDLYKSDLAARYAPGTVARRLSSLSSWYRYLPANEACERNPALAGKRPQLPARSTTAPPPPAASIRRSRCSPPWPPAPTPGAGRWTARPSANSFGGSPKPRPSPPGRSSPRTRCGTPSSRCPWMPAPRCATCRGRRRPRQRHPRL